MLAWLSVWSEVQTCMWPSWCHCHSLSLASVKSRLVLPFWYRPTQIVPEKGPLNGCVCVYLVIAMCCQLSSWTLNAINWIVVGQISWHCVRWSTAGLSFILTVHIWLQHNSAVWVYLRQLILVNRSVWNWPSEFLVFSCSFCFHSSNEGISSTAWLPDPVPAAAAVFSPLTAASVDCLLMTKRYSSQQRNCQ